MALSLRIMGILPPVVARLFADIKQFEGQMGKADGIMTGFGNTATGVGAKVNKTANRIIAAGVIIGVASVKMAADFQSATTRLVTDAGESVKNINMIRDGILGMAQAVGQTPKQLAEGMYYIESAGYHGADALKVLKASAEGASVGFTDMASMGSAVTTVLRDYNLPANRAAAVTSALITTVAQGKTTMTLLANSMGRVLPIAAAFGIPFAQTAGAIATMTVSGQQARFGVQQIRNSFMNLAAPGNMASKTIKQIGISGNELHKALMDPKNGVSNALTLITTQLGKYFPRGSAEYIRAQRTIYGGITGLSVALALGGEHLKKYNETVRLIAEAYNSANPKVKNFAEVTKTLNFQLKQLVAGSAVIGIEIGNWLLPKASAFLKWAGSVITWFKSHPIAGKIASDAAITAFGLAVGAKIIMGVMKAYGTVTSLLRRIGGTFGANLPGATFQEKQLFYLREIAFNTAKGKGAKSILQKAEDALLGGGAGKAVMSKIPDVVAKVVGRIGFGVGLGVSTYETVKGLFNSLKTGSFSGSLMSLFGLTPSQQGTNVPGSYFPNGQVTSRSYTHTESVKTKTGIKVYVVH